MYTFRKVSWLWKVVSKNNLCMMNFMQQIRFLYMSYMCTYPNLKNVIKRYYLIRIERHDGLSKIRFEVILLVLRFPILKQASSIHFQLVVNF